MCTRKASVPYVARYNWSASHWAVIQAGRVRPRWFGPAAAATEPGWGVGEVPDCVEAEGLAGFAGEMADGTFAVPAFPPEAESANAG